MERLTTRIEDKVYYSKGEYSPTTLIAEMKRNEIRECINRLAEYEDIGMTADEIKYFLKDFGMSQAIKIRELKKNNVKKLVSWLDTLKYPDKLFIYDSEELVWQGYISDKQIYKYLEDEEVVEIYLGEDGLIAKIN